MTYESFRFTTQVLTPGVNNQWRNWFMAIALGVEPVTAGTGLDEVRDNVSLEIPGRVEEILPHIFEKK